MEFSGQEYWSGLPFPSPGDLPDPGIKPVSPILEGRLLTTRLPGKSQDINLTKEIQNVYDESSKTLLKKNKDRASLVAQTVKNLPAMQETWVQSLGREDPLEK